jgi:hypothetical protein
VPIGRREVGADIRVLVALEDDYQLYREMIAAVLETLRTHAKVERTTPEALEEEIERFDPQVIICSGHEDVESGGSRAWIELSLAPTAPTKVSVGGRYVELTNPTLEELLKVIDELRVTPQY